MHDHPDSNTGVCAATARGRPPPLPLAASSPPPLGLPLPLSQGGLGSPPLRVPTALGNTSVAYTVAPLNPQVWVLPYLT